MGKIIPYSAAVYGIILTMNFGLQCLAIALLTSAAAFAEDLGERATGYRLPKNPHRTISSHSEQGGSKRTLLKSGNSTLPKKWDSREKEWITPVRNQGGFNTCWTFAAYATLEAQLLKADRGEYDFSEKNMAMLHGYELDVSDGGNNDIAAAYLLRWGGAIAETNDNYETSASALSTSPNLNPAIHVQNVVWVPARAGTSDNNTLKAAIMEYGAVATSIMWDGAYEQKEAYYYPYDTEAPNHAVAVIGWDDDYEASKFKDNPQGNGAWLIKNSWGEHRGSNGYYYVSYYDSKFAMEEDGVVFIPATAEENYTTVRGYDKLGCIGQLTSDTTDTSAAIFTSAWNEEIVAVGVYSFYDSAEFDISIYTNIAATANSPISCGECATTQSGAFTHAGYTTIRLNSPVVLGEQSNFAIVYKQKGVYPFKHALDMYEEGYSQCLHAKGNTFLHPSNSETWIDAYDKYDACVCLKAYTRSTVPAIDGPEECDSGDKMLTALAETNATLYAETGETFGAFANIVGANGRTLWSSWLAGFDPANKDDDKLIVDISVTNNVPYLSWTPNLGTDRSYRIWGSETLAEENWKEVDDLKTTEAKFFKVTVGQ